MTKKSKRLNKKKRCCCYRPCPLLSSLMKCANCDSSSVTCICKKCGDVFLCDTCFEEIHKLNIFSSHAKEPLSNDSRHDDDDDDDDSDDIIDNIRDDSSHVPEEKIKAINGYINFLEWFVIGELGGFDALAGVKLQQFCETLSDIHTALYDFESKLRAIINSSVALSKDVARRTLQDISQYQQTPLSSQIRNENISQFTKQMISRLWKTAKVFQLKNIDLMLEKLEDVKLVASPFYAPAEPALCGGPEKSDRCSIYRDDDSLIFNFGGAPAEMHCLVSNYPFINYKIEIRKLSGNQQPTCLNMGKGNGFESSIKRSDLEDTEIKMAVGFLDVAECNIWESGYVSMAGFNYNKSNGQMVCTIMNPVLDNFADTKSDDDKEIVIKTLIGSKEEEKEGEKKEEEGEKKEDDEEGEKKEDDTIKSIEGEKKEDGEEDDDDVKKILMDLMTKMKIVDEE